MEDTKDNNVSFRIVNIMPFFSDVYFTKIDYPLRSFLVLERKTVLSHNHLLTMPSFFKMMRAKGQKVILF